MNTYSTVIELFRCNLTLLAVGMDCLKTINYQQKYANFSNTNHKKT